MKYRTDFVTNSSSSSFIVMFDHKPKNVLDLLEMMFFDKKKNDILPSVSWNCTNDWMGTSEIANKVFQDIQSNLKEGYSTWRKEEIDIWTRIKQEINDNIYLLSYEKSEPRNFYYSGMRSLSGVESRIISYEEIPYSASYRFKKITGLDSFSGFYNDKTIPENDKKEYKKILNNCEEEFSKESEILAVKVIERLKEMFPNSFFTVLEYGDESGQGLLEYGDIFRFVPHIRVSHH